MKKPSVTELIKLLDKPALMYWANKQGLAGIDIKTERKKWLNDGTSMHSQVEEYVKNKTPFLNKEHQENFDRFAFDKEILFLEKKIETDYFTGRIDIAYKQNDKVFIGDFKNNQTSLYFENKLQLVSYSMAEQCDSFAIISMPSFEIIPVPIEDKTPFEEIIKALAVIYQHKNIVDPPYYSGK